MRSDLRFVALAQEQHANWLMHCTLRKNKLRLFELSVFALCLCHGLRLQFFGITVQADEKRPRRQQYSGRRQDDRGVRQLRGVLMNGLERRNEPFYGERNDDDHEESR